VAAVLCAAPFLWSLWTAVQGAGAHLRSPLWSAPFPAIVARTVLVGALVTAATVLLALPAAYALARRRWGGAAVRVIAVLALAPSVLLVQPLSWTADALGLRGSLWALVLAEPAMTVPVAVLLFAGFLRSLPVDVEEQALVDGHSRFAAFRRVVVPHLWPAIAAVAVVAFIVAAGEFVYTRALAAAHPTVAAGFTGGGAAPRPEVVLVAVPLAAAADLVLGRIVAALAGTADRS
jgi:multiple sugar transport system permease protein